MGTPLPPSQRAGCEDALGAARGRLGDAAFAAAWADGRTLTIEQAVAEAISPAPDPSCRRLEERERPHSGLSDAGGETTS
jgi:hypothetical protein